MTLQKSLGLIGIVAVLSACGADETSSPLGGTGFLGNRCGGNASVAGETVRVDGDIGEDSCWGRDIVWQLSPRADGSYVKVKPGVTLTLEAGTTVRGMAGSALIVTRGAKIIAEGTAAQPIVFTSDKAEGSRAPGDWGGILIMGAAPTNWDGNNQLFEALPETDDDGRYGGNDADDNSGVLSFVRIEFAGYEYDEDKEFNGLTLCGVGRGTRIERVQVHKGSDDGFEMFGGTVNMKWLVSSQNQDDAFDTDAGYRGKVQFLVVQAIGATSKDPNGYESDDHPSSFDATPRTSPTIWNATLIGDAAQTKPNFGAVLRRGTSGSYHNHIFTGFASAAIEVRDAQTVAQFPDALKIETSVFFENGAGGINWSAAQADFDEALSFTQSSFSNQVMSPGLSGAANLTAPSFLPQSVMQGGTPPADGFFDASATFVGAMGSTDWSAGWTGYPES